MNERTISSAAVRGSGWTTRVALAGVLFTVVPGRVRAEGPQPWLLLPSTVSVPQGERLEPLMREMASALRDEEIYPLVFDEARALFEARHSTEAVAANESDLDVVAREARAALLHVATGRNARARQAVQRVLDRAERALESLNRETDSARHVLNACLYLVRAMLDSGNREAALSRVLECRRLVPDIEPDRHDHPPQVMELLRDAETRLATARTGSLTIESNPSGCDVYLNGRQLGTTPYEIRELPPGEYRIQAECTSDRLGRVHRIHLAAEPTVVRIDGRFDATVKTREMLALEYASPEAEDQHRFGDAVAVGAIVQAGDVIVMTPREDGTIRLDRVSLADRQVSASVLVKVPAHRRAARRTASNAVVALRTERSVDLTSDEVREWTRWEPPRRTEPSPRPPPDGREDVESTPGRASRSGAAPEPSPGTRADTDSGFTPGAAGWALGATGLAALAASWGLWARLQNRNDHFSEAFPMDPDYLDRQARVDEARLPVALAGVAGGGLTSAAMPWLLPPADTVPWWAWSAGAVGLGIAAWGLVPFLGGGDLPPLLDEQCIDDKAEPDCTRKQQTELLGGLLLLHASPLLTIPITYLLRMAFTGDDATHASLRIRQASVELVVGGAL